MSVEFVAPSKVYKTPRMPADERVSLGGYSLGEPLGLAKTKTGSLGTWFQGHPFPRKTFIYNGVIQPNNKAKRITLSLFLPFASLKNGLKAFLNSYIYNYTRLIDSIYADCDQIPYLHYPYYSEFSKALWDFIYLFLRKLGIKSEIAYRFGLQLATMIEYDDAYKVRLQDITNEIDFKKNLRKEILRVLELYRQRDTFEEDNDAHAGGRIMKIAKLGSFLLYIPKVKKAFQFAIENINTEWLKLDDWDYYWTLNRGDYNCGGRTLEDRKAEMVDRMVEFAKKVNPGKKIVKLEKENGTEIVAVDPNDT